MCDPYDPLGKDFYYKVLPSPALTKVETKAEIDHDLESEFLMDAILINAGIMAPVGCHDKKWALEFLRMR